MCEVSFHGQCHCGNIELAFETNLKPEQSPVRVCACLFCRRHGTRTTSDPNGKAKITVHDSNLLIRYRFGLKTADFLICGKCGVYVGAVMTAGDKAYAVVNLNTFDSLENFRREPATMFHDGESEAGRRARREKNWTPAEIAVNSG